MRRAWCGDFANSQALSEIKILNSVKYQRLILRSQDMKFIFVILSVLIIQTTSAVNLEDTENAIFSLHSRLSKTSDDATSDSICREMRDLFISSFEDPAVFDYPFDKFLFCKLTSKDHRLRLFNWNLPYKDGTHKYFCFVLVWDAKKKNYTWTELKDNQKEVEKIENKYLNSEKWFGALYYEIIPMDKKGRGDTYTLLGWDGKDNLTNRKIIDAITIIGNKLRFGAGIYHTDDGTRKRMIMEYSDEVSASLKYHPKKNCIVMDHLSPKNPLMTGIYADYGPDGSYDLLLLKKGKWDFIENIDISEFSSGNDRPFSDPRKK